MALPSALANGLPASPFPTCAEYQGPALTCHHYDTRLRHAERLRDAARYNVEAAIKNLELAELAAKAAEANWRALFDADPFPPPPRSDRSSPVAGMTSAGAAHPSV